MLFENRRRLSGHRAAAYAAAGGCRRIGGVRATVFFAVLGCSACGTLRNCPADLVGTYERFVPWRSGDPAAGKLHRIILGGDGSCEIGDEVVPPAGGGMQGMSGHFRWREVADSGGTRTIVICDQRGDEHRVLTVRESANQVILSQSDGTDYARRR